MDQKQNFPGDSNNKLVDGILRNCPETFYEEFADHNPVLSCKVRFARITSGFEKEQLFNSIDPLDVDQRTTYTVAMNCMFDPEKTQLIVFISGDESGTEKSRLAHVIAQGAQLMFNTCKEYEFRIKSCGLGVLKVSLKERNNENNYPNFGSVLKTAPTEDAAFNIKGHTWHSALRKYDIVRYTQKTHLADI